MTPILARQGAVDSVPERVRADCAWIASCARHVSIDPSNLADYADMILSRYTVIEGHDEHHYVTEDKEKTAAYFVGLNSINFGSGSFVESGIDYIDVAGGLKRAFLKGEMSTAAEWVRAAPEDFDRMIPATGPVVASRRAALTRSFAMHLSQAGVFLMEGYGGSALRFVESAQGSAARLADIVATWPGFNDTAMCQGREVAFFKRAQIMAADLHLAGLGGFQDMDRLTCFADNMIPHVLRCDGILSYAPDLAARIDQGLPLQAGSAEEIEVRACGLHAVELLRDAAVAAGHKVTAVNLDHLLWNRGYLEPSISARKPHRTLTEAY